MACVSRINDREQKQQIASQNLEFDAKLYREEVLSIL